MTLRRQSTMSGPACITLPDAVAHRAILLSVLHRVVACNLIMEYTLSCAAISRGFSSYLATLAGLDPTFFVLKVATGCQLAPLCCIVAQPFFRGTSAGKAGAHFGLPIPTPPGGVPEDGLPGSWAHRGAHLHPVLRHQGRQSFSIVFLEQQVAVGSRCCVAAGLQWHPPAALLTRTVSKLRQCRSQHASTQSSPWSTWLWWSSSCVQACRMQVRQTPCREFLRNDFSSFRHALPATLLLD